ncbi:hypothetical protein CDAR_220671 [Caerostris darwini]|uniref:Uncharacterized protein n=1 Tax=Caerostris darwini TaxID=1538125 RepID=A0AAV4PBF0_9ARAC|nr:hypothetical protein CDAR_220671 [Caerostris darwini]
MTVRATMKTMLLLGKAGPRSAKRVAGVFARETERGERPVVARMTLDRLGYGAEFCDVMLNFMFPDLVIVEAIPGPLVHLRNYSSMAKKPFLTRWRLGCLNECLLFLCRQQRRQGEASST